MIHHVDKVLSVSPFRTVLQIEGAQVLLQTNWCISLMKVWHLTSLVGTSQYNTVVRHIFQLTYRDNVKNHLTRKAINRRHIPDKGPLKRAGWRVTTHCCQQPYKYCRTWSNSWNIDIIHVTKIWALGHYLLWVWVWWPMCIDGQAVGWGAVRPLKFLVWSWYTSSCQN